MTALTVTPLLAPPTTTVRESYLAGEHADMLHRGSDTTWLVDARRDFDQFVDDRVGIRERWGVPSEVFWFTADEHYIGSLVLRHALPKDEIGGHIGYHVVHPWQRQGHATAMLGHGLTKAREIGLDSVLLTVASDNAPSLRVIERNGGVADGTNNDGERRYWIRTRDDQARGKGQEHLDVTEFDQCIGSLHGQTVLDDVAAGS